VDNGGQQMADKEEVVNYVERSSRPDACQAASPKLCTEERSDTFGSDFRKSMEVRS
jgi:hypothetical protein